MSSAHLSDTARHWIAAFDSGAHRAIAAWRSGGQRVGGFARTRWDTAFAESSPQLSEETRVNATRLRDAVARNFARGLDLSAIGAETAVGTLVQAARSGVEHAEAWRRQRA